MKHIRKFESYRTGLRRNDIIKESVLQVNDIYKVRTLIDIPQSLINAYVKKVKDTTGKNLRQFFGDVDIAEEVVKWVTLNFINVDQVPAGALTGDAQAGQAPESQVPGQAQVQGGQAQVQGGQAQVQGAQGQPAPQGQAQPGQANPQVQVQTEAQPEGQGDFEEVGEDGQSQDEEDEEELPL
jgi:hypothetical protein